MKQYFDYLDSNMNKEAQMFRYFDYLEILRKSGVTNMFGAVPYLQQEFGLERRESLDILKQWMGSYRG